MGEHVTEQTVIGMFVDLRHGRGAANEVLIAAVNATGNVEILTMDDVKASGVEYVREAIQRWHDGETRRPDGCCSKGSIRR